MVPKPHPVRPGQLSVWDFPRPAIVEPEQAILRVEVAGTVLAETRAGFRTLETSHPPSYYFPPADVRMALLRPSQKSTFCEWKGAARYFDVVVGDRLVPNAAWAYPTPRQAFACMAHCVAFYPGLMDRCSVDGEAVEPQRGPFYGGWITAKYAGPFKGVPGSDFW